MIAIKTPTPTFAQRLTGNVRSAPLLIAGLIGLLASPLLHGQSTIQFAAAFYLVNEDAGEVVVTVLRANDLDTVVTVDYATSDAMAIAGEDYLASSGTLSFAAGQTEQALSVVILNDGLVQGTRQFLITLSNPGAGASLGPRTSSSVRIRDNDTGPHFTSTTYDTVQDVGTLWIGVHRGDDGDQPVTVGYATQNGTALAGQHYQAASGTLRFEGDEFLASIPVVILNAGIEEADKTFQIQLADASSGGVGLPSLASVRIQDPTPMLYTQPSPVSQSVSLGALVRIQVSAKGAVMQWQRRVDDGEFEDIPDATSPVLEWEAPTTDLTGEYRFLVGDASGHSIISQTATVHVDPTFTKIVVGEIVSDSEPSTCMAWLDLHNNGFLDLYVGNSVVSGNVRDSFYRNHGNGTFTKLTTTGITAMASRAFDAAVGDYHNDGHADLYVGRPDNISNTLFRNEGNGQFSVMTAEQVGPLVEDTGHTYAVSWGDYDNDGFLDLFVANYSNQKDFLYRNQGDGQFARMTTDEVGQIVASAASSSGAAWGDFDNDGYLDLYVAVAGGTSYLYRNNRDGTFLPLVVESEVSHSVSPTWGDYDNDGFLDLFVTHGASGYSLYRNLGGESFAKVTESAGLNFSMHATIGLWGDYDNDGFLDLYIQSVRGVNVLYRNNGDGTFSSMEVGSPRTDGVRDLCASWVDYDNDGFLDLFIVCGDAQSERNLLYRNNGNQNAWLKVQLIGTASNRMGIGAKVRVQATINGATAWQLREASGNGAWAGGNGIPLHFGLGNATQVDGLRIEWPSGTVQEFTNVDPRQILTVTEPPRLIPQGVGAFQIQCWIHQSFEVQASTDLVTWSTVDTVINKTGTLVYEDAQAGQNECRYYRVRSE